MKICFILPRFTRQPIGGYKMVYEYSNRLVLLGHDIHIAFDNSSFLDKKKVPSIIKKIIACYFTKTEPKWFQLNSRINKISIFNSSDFAKLESYDIAIATAVETVEILDTLPEKIRKFYFIQDYENWKVADNIVIDTYRRGYTNIVISQWLKDIVESNSFNEAHLIRNPIDITIYRQTKEIQEKPVHSLSVLYHEQPHKGFLYAFNAIKKLKEIYPDLKVEAFGIFPRPNYFPEYIHYTRGATTEQVVEIYNNTRVYLCASVDEGFGLTGLEAMACGTVLVSTNYKGVREYAVNGENSLLSEVYDVDGLVKQVCYLFNKEYELYRLSHNGLNYVKEQYNWNNSIRGLEDLLYGR